MVGWELSTMVTLLYHSRSVGGVCRKIANVSVGKIEAVCDRTDLPPLKTVIRWDSSREAVAEKSINSLQAVSLSRNKKASRLVLGDLAPLTWFKLEDLKFPCLIRPARHFAAHGFYVCKEMWAARKAVRRCRKRGWYASPIIDKKLEFRVFVLLGRVLKVVRRFHLDPKEIAWNSANGGKSIRVMKESWPKDVVKAAVKAGKVIGLDWYAADVIVDQNDRPLVLELNTAPGLERRKTIANFAKEFSKC